MTTTATTTMATLRRALEASDGVALAALYADDAEVRFVDRAHPPSHPLVLSGRAAIAAHWEDVCGRDMTHRVADELETADRLAFTEDCGYPDGTRVLCATVAHLRGGAIVRQVVVQAWDE
jgi:ketosteroid isomerase-like protein